MRRFRISIQTITIHSTVDLVGDNICRFSAYVDQVVVGEPDHRLVAGRMAIYSLTGWHIDLERDNRSSVNVNFQLFDIEVVRDEDLGSYTHVVHWPFTAGVFTATSRNYTVTWAIEELESQAEATVGDATARMCRESNGGVLYNTAAAVGNLARIEVHDVYPWPTQAGTLLPRPTFPASAPQGIAINDTAITVGTSTAQNAIPNPAVIAIYPRAQRSSHTTAKFSVTYYRPNTLGFTRTDPRLEWRILRTSSGNAEFVGGNTGLEVQLHGTTQGEIVLQVYFQNALAAYTRALVAPIKHIPCRVNLLKTTRGTGAGTGTSYSAADMMVQLNTANRFLWQLGVLLRIQEETDIGHVEGGVAATDVVPVPGHPGFFQIEVPQGMHTNMNGTTSVAPLLNGKPWVVNFACIHTESRGPAYAAAADYSAAARGSITDSGTPSTSCKSHSGIPPDSAATAVTMAILGSRQRQPNFYVVYVGSGLTLPGTADQIADWRGRALAHEVGHTLGLGHRIEDPAASLGSWADGVNFPPTQNVMHYQALGPDLDIIQAKAIRESPLIHHY